MEQAWTDICSMAREQLLKIDGDRFDSFISLLHEPVHGKYWYLHLSWEEAEVKWHLNEWDADAEALLYNDPAEKWKRRGMPMYPQVQQHYGTWPIKELDILFLLIEKIHANPIVNSKEMIAVNASQETLSIGVSESSCSYTWHILPPSWISLGNVVSHLHTLKSSIQY
ncbi:hypothetical protein COR50_18800 [Chitinophaga caeni]|uniref:Uncharacterized protein n=1 Tax=Chitinophaga caeni TaxID=2029983 RepID=A0A291QYX9_9BACT|nr:hypothetical protein [Chitinophaga caeni]ATL49054.1 hypothetical protein COR50_18800 [Chitinophaga caeni]